MNQMKDKVVIVTGASMGIGYAGAQRFSEEGAVVAICGRNKAKLDEATEKLSAYGTVHSYNVDISDKVGIQAMVDDLKEKYGHIDVLVNNASIIKDSSFKKMTDEQFSQVIDVDLKGTFYVTKAVSAVMIEQRSGSIINCSSISATVGTFGQANYAAAKAGIVGMTRVLSKELGRYGIRVNAVSPGGIWTSMYETIPEDQLENRKKAIPLGRFGESKEVAALYLFLASDESSYITGQNIVIDGGRS